MWDFAEKDRLTSCSGDLVKKARMAAMVSVMIGGFPDEAGRLVSGACSKTVEQFAHCGARVSRTVPHFGQNMVASLLGGKGWMIKRQYSMSDLRKQGEIWQSLLQG